LALDIEARMELRYAPMRGHTLSKGRVGFRQQINMNVVPHVERCPYRRNFALEPGAYQIVAKPGLLERPNRIRDHELPKIEVHGFAQEAVILPGEAFRQSVGGKSPKRRFTGAFVLLECRA